MPVPTSGGKGGEKIGLPKEGPKDKEAGKDEAARPLEPGPLVPVAPAAPAVAPKTTEIPF
jgi:hypothetical protein